MSVPVWFTSRYRSWEGEVSRARLSRPVERKDCVRCGVRLAVTPMGLVNWDCRRSGCEYAAV